MTKKRFTINDCRVLSDEQVLKILNQLTDENEQLKEKNKELKEKNKFILWQIKAFRDDCVTACDFDGASTLNRLLDILREER